MKIKQGVTLVFGLLAAGVGAWRHLETGTRPQALWFGVVMGALAILGAALLALRNRIPGYLLIWTSLGFVAGWFLNRMLSGHPEGKSVRVVIILIACAVELGVLLWKSPEPRGPENTAPGEQNPAGQSVNRF